MEAQEVITRAHGYIATMGKKSDEGVTSLFKREYGWTVCIEELERKGIPDTMDILGLYEINLDNEGDLLSVDRKKLRKRGDTADN
ncbi:MAG TPA: gas vesicle protein GvpO [Dehalococcoidales bacterium]